MDFDNFIIEMVPEGKVIAHGQDLWGQFQINGSFNPANSKVVFVKSYENGTIWTYFGNFANNNVEGHWGQT